jgi:hypothetical protein
MNTNNAATAAPEILACPHCGITANDKDPTTQEFAIVATTYSDSSACVVQCNQCGMSGPILASIPVAISAWNRLARIVGTQYPCRHGVTRYCGLCETTPEPAKPEPVGAAFKIGDLVMTKIKNRWGLACAGKVMAANGGKADVLVWNMHGPGADAMVMGIPFSQLSLDGQKPGATKT